MARLIDADDFLKRLNERPVDYIDPGCDFYYLEETVESVLNETPTVDAVEVVRCKDCKHGVWDEDDQMWECIVGVDLTGDPDIYSMFHEYNDGMHFCSYGERRTDG